ncbi:MAG: phosphoglucosamine mutase [Planctomycetota bacterium]|nr:MAG: phosphoglucosamine mutase [Planctomycetota bacterium]
MKLFGTDGIRGKANQPPLDSQTLVNLGIVLGRQLNRSSEEALVLFAHDGRRSSGQIRCALEAGLLSTGASTRNGGLLTTPALAHETRLGHYSAGVMLSASHNPAEDNGIKLFGGDGRKLADSLEAKIEQEMASGVALPEGEPGMSGRFKDPGLDYRRWLEEAPFAGLSLSGLRILVDCANGAGSRLAPRVLSDLGASLVIRNDRPDGSNINLQCGALYPNYISEEVRSQGCDLGLCLDGDGDRSIFVDDAGQVVHGDALLCLLAEAQLERGELAKSKIAVTVMSNLALKKRLRARGIEIVETPVGDRSVVAAMEEQGLSLGGEPSGHIIFGPEHHYTGDGLYTCLKLLRLLKSSGKALSALTQDFRPFPQLLVNVRVNEKPALDSLPRVVEAQKAVEERLGEDGRVVLRYSGTENLCRVMIEGPEEGLVRELTEQLADAVRLAIGAPE